MSGRRKPRDPESGGPLPSGWSLADYRASGVLDTPLPAKQYVVTTAAGEFSIHPHSPEGEAEAQRQADLYHGTVTTRSPKPTTYWKSGETHHDH